MSETHTVLSPDFLRETVDLFEALAAEHGAEYDGWEASVEDSGSVDDAR